MSLYHAIMPLCMFLASIGAEEYPEHPDAVLGKREEKVKDKGAEKLLIHDDYINIYLVLLSTLLKTSGYTRWAPWALDLP